MISIGSFSSTQKVFSPNQPRRIKEEEKVRAIVPVIIRAHTSGLEWHMNKRRGSIGPAHLSAASRKRTTLHSNGFDMFSQAHLQLRRLKNNSRTPTFECSSHEKNLVESPITSHLTFESNDVKSGDF